MLNLKKLKLKTVEVNKKTKFFQISHTTTYSDSQFCNNVDKNSTYEHISCPKLFKNKIMPIQAILKLS